MADLLSSPAKTLASADLYLTTEGLPPDVVFHRLKEELATRRRVWVSGSLFATLVAILGQNHDGVRWLEFAPHDKCNPEWLSRLRDIVAAVLALLLLSPFLFFFALLVRLSSPGPVLYSTRVVGRYAREFAWFKFRSMRVVNREQDESKRKEQYRAFMEQSRHSLASKDANVKDAKVIDDSRVTTIGKFLRKYSLDELPQLLNVLKSQMSIVGPRPCLPYEAEMFPSWARSRFAIVPGLTGVWQVYGRSRVSFDEAMAMDIYYIYNRSLWLDTKLILGTIMVVLKGQGAR